jgi:23S rRNA (cytosine1962-C5)-methyltransferase
MGRRETDKRRKQGAAPETPVRQGGEASAATPGGVADHAGGVPAEVRPLRLRRREERRIKAGHLWVFSNEIDIRATPLKDFQPGEEVALLSSSGRFLGYGYVNPHSLISVRLLSRRVQERPDEQWLRRRVASAHALRDRWLGDARFCRLIHGEGDLLPGLVVDRYGELLVGQITTAGMQRRRETLEQVLREVPGVTALVWANDLPVRDLEGLVRETSVAFGEVADTVTVHEGGASFQAAPLAGQKTGWYYDQRHNRDRLTGYVKGARVLDVFSYIGAWGVRAAIAGASSVTCVDSSASALAAARANATCNGVTLETIEGDAVSVLKQLVQAGRRFDVVVIDPPALIPRRKDKEAGTRAYWQLNELAMRLLDDDALLVSCSCSHHLDEQDLNGIVAGCARHQHRQLQVLERGAQSPDHPVHPAIPETRYLKALFCRVTSSTPAATLSP